jgi:hypothetical protein
MLLSTVEVPDVVGRKWVRTLRGIGGRVSHEALWLERSRAMRTDVATMLWHVWLESDEKRSGEWNVFRMSAILSVIC